jgi:hypothetical protein
VFVGEIDWHTITRLENHMHCFYLCQSISPTNTRLWSYILLSYMSFNFPYKYKTGGSYVLIVCQSPLQTRQEDHMYWLSVNLPYKHKTGGSYALLSFVSVNLPYKQDWRIIRTTFICVSQSQMKVVHMILQSCVCRGDWQTISTYDPPVLFVGEIDRQSVHMILLSCL